MGYGSQGHAHALSTKGGLKEMLAEIQDGSFARNWDVRIPRRPEEKEHNDQDAEPLLETTGKELRTLMSWVNGGQ
ncbi:hypothetical protein OJ963_41600 [Streptomyces sp. RS2]|nr:hypothetical protein [Streptomyces sp. RS2]